MNTMRIIVLADQACGVLGELKRLFDVWGMAPVFECRDESGSMSQVRVEFPLPAAHKVDEILRAVEAVKGAAVMAAAEVDRRS